MDVEEIDKVALDTTGGFFPTDEFTQVCRCTLSYTLIHSEAAYSRLPFSRATSGAHRGKECIRLRAECNNSRRNVLKLLKLLKLVDQFVYQILHEGVAMAQP